MSNIPNSMRAPPSLTEGKSYEFWKKEIKIWQLLKVATAKEEGPLIFTNSLTERDKKVISELTVDEIGSDQGLKKILDKLDKLYLADKNQRTFAALDQFEKYKRPSNTTMSDFILEFTKLHNKVTEFEL